MSEKYSSNCSGGKCTSVLEILNTSFADTSLYTCDYADLYPNLTSNQDQGLNSIFIFVNDAKQLFAPVDEKLTQYCSRPVLIPCKS